MAVRSFEKADTKKIIQLFRDTVRNVNLRDYSVEQVHAWAPDKIDLNAWEKRLTQSYTYVALENEKIVGCANLEGNGHIDLFYVHKDYQGQGFAKQLYSIIEQKARDLGIRRMFSEVSITARAFFESRGFEVEREQTVRLRGADFKNFVMIKNLPS